MKADCVQQPHGQEESREPSWEILLRSYLDRDEAGVKAMGRVL